MRGLFESIVKRCFIAIGFLIPSDSFSQYHLFSNHCLDSSKIEDLIELKVDSVIVDFEVDFFKIEWHTEEHLEWSKNQADLEFILGKYRVEERSKLVNSMVSESIYRDVDSEWDEENDPCPSSRGNYYEPTLVALQFEQVGLQELITQYNYSMLKMLNHEGQASLNGEIEAWNSYLSHRGELIEMDLEGGSGCGGTSAITGFPTLYNEILKSRLEEVYKRYRYTMECYPLRPHFPYYNHQDESE